MPMSESTRSERKPARKMIRLRTKLLVAFASFLAAFGIAEMILRGVGISYPVPYSPDEYCGSRLEPGFIGYWSKEGAAPIEVNSFGFRDREHAIEKPDNVVRIAVLGDSYIEAFQVPIHEMFGSVLEKTLNARAQPNGPSFEVLSFGVSGWSTSQELLCLRHHVWQFEPDIVLLAFLPQNDVRGNSRSLEPERRRPFFELAGDDLTPDFSFRKDPVWQYASTSSCRIKNAIINASRVVQIARAVRDGEHRFLKTRRLPDNAGQVGLDDQCYMPPQDEAWQSAWTLTERLIDQMNHEVVARNRVFAVAVLTSGKQVNPDDDVRESFLRRLKVEDLSYSNRRIEEAGRRSGFATITLSQLLLEYAKRHAVHVHGFHNTPRGEGHWNRHGHRAAADVCGNEILKLWLRRSSKLNEQKKPFEEG